MKTTRESILSDPNAMEKTDHTIQVLLGTLGVSIFCMLGLIVWLSSSIKATNKLEVRHYNDSVTIESLKANLTMPVEIRKYNQLNQE